MSSMTSLPVELVQEIGGLICKLEEKKNLRATCVKLALALSPQLFKEVVLDVNRDTLGCGLHLLETLASCSLLCEYVRTLSIESLAPSFYLDPAFPDRKVYTSYLLDHARQRRIEDGMKCTRREEAQCMMEKLLLPAVSSLSQLRVFRWTWHWTDSVSTLKTVMAALGALIQLEEFHFCYIPDPETYDRDEECTLPLPGVTNLKVISLTIPEDPEVSWKRKSAKLTDPALVPFVKHLLSGSPSVSKLYLDNGSSCIGLWARLNDILEEFLPLPELRELTFGGWKISLTDKMCAQLRLLTSLELLHCTKFNPDVWPFLQEEQIHLQRLGTDNVSDTLLDYLSSYSNKLVHLSLTGPTWYSSQNYNDLADRFFNEVLPLHKETLESLEVLPTFEGRWCFEENNSAAIQSCLKLKNLSVKVNCINMPDMEDAKSDNGIVWPGAYHTVHKTTTHNPVHLLLNTIATSSLSDSLETLSIDGARSTGMVRSMADSYFGPGYRIGARKRIRKSVETFEFVEAVNRTNCVSEDSYSCTQDVGTVKKKDVKLSDQIRVVVAGVLCSWV
ncbi:hypothetical protein D9758_011650 [Tetrapyrgos nigripes]|uniref:F-box domain-containing protein n=1 Tax=Tetrapyrgos nigripes TaxID=182062 RepID=A0A8H5CUX5_9AGAR|nr:hypothetical protein D9758_011650 [Tetrapyrgos nigripes]